MSTSVAYTRGMRLPFPRSVGLVRARLPEGEPFLPGADPAGCLLAAGMVTSESEPQRRGPDFGAREDRANSGCVVLLLAAIVLVFVGGAVVLGTVGLASGLAVVALFAIAAACIAAAFIV